MSRRDPQGLGYDPGVLRGLLAMHQRILGWLNDFRRESTDVEELIGIAYLTDEHHRSAASIQRRLDRIECQRHTEARREAYVQGEQFQARMAALETSP